MKLVPDWLRQRLPQHYDYNVIVVGGGAAGLVSAYLTAGAQARVALVEKARMGGDCLYTGCVPSKTLIRSARLAHEMRQAQAYGLDCGPVTVDFSQVMKRIQAVIRAIEPHDSIARYQQLGVACFQGEARLLSGHAVQVGEQVLTARRIILATGATPVIPDVPGLEDVPYLTSETIWSLSQLPRHLVIVGGGPIGCELAQAFRRLGSEVTLIVHGSRLLKREDSDVSEYLQSQFVAEGIALCFEHDLSRVFSHGGEIIVQCQHGEEERRISGDVLLLAIGRQPGVAGLGLEELGVALDAHGALHSDGTLRTSLPSVYCAGDVVGPYQFTHMAAHQAATAGMNALFDGLWRQRVDLTLVPWATFVDPEVARAGLNEQEAARQGVAYEVSRYDYAELDRAVADGRTSGWIKVLTVPGKDTILGVTIVGAQAGDCLAEFVLAMKSGLGLKKILATIHIYPTLAEGGKQVAGVWQKNHLPHWLWPWLARFHRWMRGGE